LAREEMNDTTQR